ncbi:hypothetical protein [Streptomyces sp. NPDC057253]|uniref:hypothetical protein n=1 Tax=Streptomyces sp. NPDC057253 TaxID=3346069 RepID=UPI003631D6CB
MTMHAMVLPGYQPHSIKCGYCQAELGLVQGQFIVPLRVSLLNAWKKALQKGPAAIDAYLSEHNVKHKVGCPFSDVPPAVHASCEGYDDEGRDAWHQLLHAREELDKARTWGNRHAD